MNRMKLLTAEIRKALPPVYSTDELPLEEKIVICKFFTPDANWTWYVFEGEETDDGDFEFFGMVHGNEKELGYFRLSQIEEIRGRLRLPVERDRSVFKVPYRELVK